MRQYSIASGSVRGELALQVGRVMLKEMGQAQAALPYLEAASQSLSTFDRGSLSRRHVDTR